jgi:hypothetical protein
MATPKQTSRNPLYFVTVTIAHDFRLAVECHHRRGPRVYTNVTPASQQRLKVVLNRLAWDMTVTLSQIGLTVTFWRPADDGWQNPMAHTCQVEIRTVVHGTQLATNYPKTPGPTRSGSRRPGGFPSAGPR